MPKGTFDRKLSNTYYQTMQVLYLLMLFQHSNTLVLVSVYSLPPFLVQE